MRFPVWLLGFIVGVCALLCSPVAATAQTGAGTWLNATYFPLPPPLSSTHPGMTTGPDGALWFTEYESSRIGRITLEGVVTTYDLPLPGSGPSHIVAGPDGALWFTETVANQIGRITTTGAITEYPLPLPSSNPVGITSGPDGALWFTEGRGGRIGRITVDGAITEFPLAPASSPQGITIGPDGALWFAEAGTMKVGRMTTTGQLTEFALDFPPYEITTGPDGALWVALRVTSIVLLGGVARVTTDGDVSTLFARVGIHVRGITTAPDGAVWFGVQDNGAGALGRITGDGSVVEFPRPSGDSIALTVGPDQNLWFAGRAAVGTAPPCGLGFSLSSSAGNVHMHFNLGTPVPATWGVWLARPTGPELVYSQDIPAVAPPARFTVTVPAPEGPNQLGLGSTLAVGGDYRCAEWAVVQVVR